MSDENTTTLQLDEPVDEAYIKLIDAAQEAEDSFAMAPSRPENHGEVSQSTNLQPDYGLRSAGVPLKDWLADVAVRVSRYSVFIFGAFEAGLARAIVRNLDTGELNVPAIMRPYRQYVQLTVNISPGLRMPRSEVLASSFVGSSGAYLTWIALAEDAPDDA